MTDISREILLRVCVECEQTHKKGLLKSIHGCTEDGTQKKCSICEEDRDLCKHIINRDALYQLKKISHTYCPTCFEKAMETV